MKKRPDSSPAPEFSRPVPIVDIRDDDETVVVVTASEADRRALARRFDLVELRWLEARIALRRNGSTVRVRTHISAQVVQNCVITLEPVISEVGESAEIAFAPSASVLRARREELVIDPEDEDPPEPVIGDTIDVGEVVAEQLGLGLDPYPRKPGAAFEPPSEKLESGAEHPFAELGRLRR